MRQPFLHKAFNLDNTAYQAPWALASIYFKSGQGNRALPYFDLALQAAPSTVLPEIQVERSDCLAGVGEGCRMPKSDYKVTA